MPTVVFVIALVHAGTCGYGQITLNEKKIPLEKVLAAIEKQTKYVFLYDAEELRTINITINIKNATLRETLEKCFSTMPIEFTIIGRNVLIRKKAYKNLK